jgi:TRAP-type C4-dicarboxylate transport system permease small subunit
MRPNLTRNFIGRTLNAIHRIEDLLLAILLIGMILLATGQILLRNVFDIGLVWADPLLRIMVLWLGLLGALTACRENKHITIDVLTRLLSEKARLIARVLTSLFTTTVSAIIAYHAARFVIMEYEAQSSAVLGVPAWVYESIIPLAFGLIALRYIIHSIVYIRTLLLPSESA